MLRTGVLAVLTDYGGQNIDDSKYCEGYCDPSQTLKGVLLALLKDIQVRQNLIIISSPDLDRTLLF